MQPRTMVQVHGLPPWLSWRNASGIAQGGPADASVGMALETDTRATWAYNNVYGAWMALHIIRSGDTLWALSGRYYGQRSMEGVHYIGRIEQNAPILGSSYDKAVPGDVILIPTMEPQFPGPAFSIPSPPPPGAQPPPGGDPVPQPGDPGQPGTANPIDWLPEQPPPGWPPTMPWPPLQVGPGPVDPTPTDPGPINGGGEPRLDPGELPPGMDPPPGGWEPPPGVEPIPAGAIVTTKKKEPETWWTTGRIALVGGLSVATIGLIVWGSTRGTKTKRRRARPRRTTPRRRRR